MKFDTGHYDWSDATPAGDGYILCEKDHYNIQFKDNGDDVNLRELLETAKECPDYKHSDEATRLGIADA